MRFRRQAFLVAATLAALAFSQTAKADLLISVDKAKQEMTVTVDGVDRYVWPVSTGRSGYDTPDGDFKPFRMEKDHFSREWDDAPMPYSIFFTKIGHAIHGTYETRNLGKPVSHGCVRLSRDHAAILWDLVKEQKMANTKVVLTGEIPGGGGVPVARRQPNYERDYRGDGYYYDDDDTAMASARGRRVYGNAPTYYYGGLQPYYYQDRQPYAARRYYQAPAPAPFPFGW